MTDRTAVVTGASRGIGRAIALRLAADGARVVVNYQSNEQAALDVVATIVKGGGQAIAVPADVSSPVAVQQLFDEAARVFGGVDIVVNNAGLVTNTLLEGVTNDEFERVIGVNLRGTFLTLRWAARHLRDGGRLINVSSGLVKAPFPGFTVYAATKAAVEAMTATLAKELGRRQITVNCVRPGVVDTEGLVDDTRQNLGMIVAMTPLGRLGQPADIADVVGFLASDDARWVTGQVIPITGGLS